MKKRDLKTLALMGLTSGLIVTSQGESSQNDGIPSDGDHVYLAAASTNGCPGSKNGCPASKKVWPSALKQGCGAKASCNNVIADNDSSGQGKTPFQSPASKADEYKQDPNDGNLGYHLMTEDELMLELNDEGIKMYKSLSKEGKDLALKVASTRCNGTNECAGLNACKTDKNECAGKGSCKGQGKCAFSDKNQAVKAVYDKMRAKRSGLLHK